jgi:hypothetical protein
VPAAIAQTFEDREVERTKLAIKQEEQKLKKKRRFLFIQNLKFRRRCRGLMRKLKASSTTSTTK